MQLPRIIQGGMGIGVSNWQLAGAVAKENQMGVVSGICLDEVLVRRLQDGDPGGHMRRALEHFPIKDTAKKILDKFFKENKTDRKYQYNNNLAMTDDREELIIAGNFTEIFLAKEASDSKGSIGVNFLEKIQTDCLPAIFGCILAGVDFVTMGAGIPKEIPGIIDKLTKGSEVDMRVNVAGAVAMDDFKLKFNPVKYLKDIKEKIFKKPGFVAIVSSNILAHTLAKKANGPIDGFIIENHTAGGHNAPPRGAKLTNKLEYGEKDKVDLDKIALLDIPYWLAGGYGLPGGLSEALKLGAAGIQAGSIFALCQESGLLTEVKQQIIDFGTVHTDAKASPTGFPFKIVSIPGTLSEKVIYEARPRKCNLGYLRERYRKDNGSIGFRCAAEPIESYIKKGGSIEDANGAKCLCNALMANIGHGTTYNNGYEEPMLLTAGDSLEITKKYGNLSAGEIVNMLLKG